jgi:hypothetical protein
MDMKHLFSAVFAAAVLSTPVVQASDNETIFLPAQGKLVIPHLRLGNEIYYAILNRTPNANLYQFNLENATVFKITPQPGEVWATRTQVVGDWKLAEVPGATLGIFASGSYSVTTPAEEGCPAGTETGTWTLDERTGVFFAVAVTDANGDCGLSHPDGAVRIKRVGANLEVIVKEVENGVQQTVQLNLSPG